MVAPVWMESMRSLASVCLDSLAATASMISMSVTPSPASMEAHVSTVMGPTSARVLMATLGSTARYDESIFCQTNCLNPCANSAINFFCFSVNFRILYAGVIYHHVRMEDRAGSRECHTPASARLDGQVSIVTFPASPVRSQPDSKVNNMQHGFLY